MPPRDPQAVREKLGQTSLKVDSFFLRKTGFVANQTVLKLGEYNLNCVPASIGLEESRFLAVLTPSEVNFFSKYKTGLHILILTFDDPDKKDIARFPLRVGLSEVEPIPNRKDVCLLTLKLKSIPAEFVLFLGAYQDDLEARQTAWDGLGGHLLDLSPALALEIGAGYGFVLSSGQTRVSVEILAFHTKEIRVRCGLASIGIPDGSACQLRLTFRGQPLTLEGTLANPESFIPDFHPDWLTFVEECQFHTNLHSRAKAGGTV